MKDCCVDHASFCDYQRGMYIVIPKLYFHPKKEQGHIKRTYMSRVFPFDKFEIVLLVPLRNWNKAL
jgi:predicted amidophosphoribosyltransferase